MSGPARRRRCAECAPHRRRGPPRRNRPKCLAFRAQPRRENEQAKDHRGDEKICRRGGGQCAGRRIGRGAGHEGHKCARRG